MINVLNIYALEAAAFGKYLTGRLPSVEIQARYAEAMDKMGVALTQKEEKILSFMLRNTWSIGAIDGALALKDPDGNLRKKIFVLLAILEASTEFTELFLPIKFPSGYIFAVLFAGIRGVFRTILGYLLLAFLG